jgi:hypothetical protein
MMRYGVGRDDMKTESQYSAEQFNHHWGDVAKWLGSGLQNRLRQFNSGRHLQFSDLEILVFREN